MEYIKDNFEVNIDFFEKNINVESFGSSGRQNSLLSQYHFGLGAGRLAKLIVRNVLSKKSMLTATSKLSFIYSFFLILFSSSLAIAEISKTGQNGKSFEFDDLLVQGKYQFANDSITTVEEDKVLDALLSVRKDFKDRVKAQAARY